MRLPWQQYICQSKYARFCSSSKVTYLHTKNEGVLNIFISKFASLSQRSALKIPGWLNVEKEIAEHSKWMEETDNNEERAVMKVS